MPQEWSLSLHTDASLKPILQSGEMKPIIASCEVSDGGGIGRKETMRGNSLCSNHCVPGANNTFVASTRVSARNYVLECDHELIRLIHNLFDCFSSSCSLFFCFARACTRSLIHTKTSADRFYCQGQRRSPLLPAESSGTSLLRQACDACARIDLRRLVC